MQSTVENADFGGECESVLKDTQIKTTNSLSY